MVETLHVDAGNRTDSSEEQSVLLTLCPPFFQFLFVCLFFIFETGFTTETRLTLNSQRSACLCLPSAEAKDAHHHAGLSFKF